MATTSDPALVSRTTPVQARGLARVDALLDAAAEIVDTAGVVGMTTSAIAERSGSSVGAVYRYFPNADAVLIALAARNRERFMQRVSETFAEQQPADWMAFSRMCVDVYAALGSDTPGFRVVRFGDVVSMRFANQEASNNEQLAQQLDDVLLERYGFEGTQALLFATQVAMECADALTRRAFLRETAGDERFLIAAKELIIGILALHAPEAPVGG